MSKKNNAEMKKAKDQVANVPNPPVPNRARTEMKSKKNGCSSDSCEIKYENKCERK